MNLRMRESSPEMVLRRRSGKVVVSRGRRTIKKILAGAGDATHKKAAAPWTTEVTGMR